ncbi:hypothetical protein CLOM_g9253 [Closterium sp. NIES-68]|nr:hypothetical protein CLOM_g9253 [Closterium sp. NIES-68]GJP60234.1 hypothetical protein CLOP_g17445 [Closterium sp. NIES-67]
MTDINESSSVGYSESSARSTNGCHSSTTNGHVTSSLTSSTTKATPAGSTACTDGYKSADNDAGTTNVARQGLSELGSAENGTVKSSTPAVGTESTESRFLARRAELEREWLRRCAPILLHPTHDIHAGHALVRVFFRFVREGEEAEARSRGKEWSDYMAAGEDFVEWGEAAEARENTGGREGEDGAAERGGAVEGLRSRDGETPEDVSGIDADDLLCELVVVYEGEASYRRLKPHQVNHMATFFYMSFNKLVFGRTADIDYLTITGVNLSLDPNLKPWRSVRTTDHCGTQTWSQGNKANLAWWLSLFHHYTVDIPYDKLQKDEEAEHRPVIYVNTANHLMGETNANPHFPLTTWRHYPLHRGGPPEAELFARKSILSKPIIWNPFPGLVASSCF